MYLRCVEAILCKKSEIYVLHDFGQFSYFSQNLVISPTVGGRPTGSTRVACGPLNLFKSYSCDIHDRKKACSNAFYLVNDSNFDVTESSLIP